MAALGKGVVGIFPDEIRKRRTGIGRLAFRLPRRGAARGLLRSTLVARDQDDRVVLVELDIHRAHRALGVVDLVDALLLLLDALVSLATEPGENALDLLDLGSGDLVVIFILA